MFHTADAAAPADVAYQDSGDLIGLLQKSVAFVETFMQELGRTSVSIKELHERPVALIRAKRPLRFIDLCAKGGQMRLGLDGRICTGSYAVAQAWSDALRKHPKKPDGILFPSRHELNFPSCAIFETVKDALKWERWGTLDEPGRSAELRALLKMGKLGLNP